MARAAISAVDAGTCVAQALPAFQRDIAGAAAWHVIAAGKAAGPMIRACLAMSSTPPARAMIVAPRRIDGLPPPVECFVGSHPTPGDGSVAAGRRALEIATEVDVTDVLLVLLSGGASSLLELPAEGVTLSATVPAKAILVAGKPLGEPIMQHGPFVMNTKEEIYQAIRDYQEGRLG